MPDDTIANDRLTCAIAAIDAANSLDPNHVTAGGHLVPAQLLYGRRMTESLLRFDPLASEVLRLAVRAQHIRRWMIPRGSYPMTRAGYHQWRTSLYKFHADTAGEILRQVGYEEATVLRAQSLIRKERIKSDAEAQALEDVVCLVFLEYDYVDFARAHEPEKVIHILVRTWKKMSEKGHAAALALAPLLPEAERELVVRAVALAGQTTAP